MKIDLSNIFGLLNHIPDSVLEIVLLFLIIALFLVILLSENNK